MNLVILDRDGVINEDSDAYIKSPDEWIPVPGSLQAIARLNQHGFKVVVASNQSGLARGLFQIDDLNAIHNKLRKMLDQVGGQIEGIFFCPHGPDADCQCRKPRPGLLIQIRERFGIDFQSTPVVGDSFRDLQAAAAVGAEPILVRTGKGESTLRKHQKGLSDVHVESNLAGAVDYIIEKKSRNNVV